jgi:hypothetical protein
MKQRKQFVIERFDVERQVWLVTGWTCGANGWGKGDHPKPVLFLRAKDCLKTAESRNQNHNTKTQFRIVEYDKSKHHLTIEELQAMVSEL